MPQLDAFTYISQYVYLCITFGLSYAFSVNFVIPHLVTIFKLRQKLNTLGQVNSKLNHSMDQKSLDSLVLNHDVYKLVQQLEVSKWFYGSKPSKLWPISSSVLMMMSMLKLKKALCSALLVRIRDDSWSR